MTSNRQQNTTFSDEENINLPTETSARRADNFKWTPNRERIFIELYDRAIAMGDYRFKNPTPAGREFLVDKFNQEFNINVTYRFFKEKLDQLKRKYKKYKHLMKISTGISVDPTKFVISAFDSWWKDREINMIVKSFKRKPPELWDVMQRCFILYDVQSQSQYSLHQRREELMNDGQNNDDGHFYSETYGGDMQHTQVPDTQENEEVYRVNINDEMRPSNEFIRENLHQNSSHVADHFQIPTSRVQQRDGLRRGSSSQRGAGNSRIFVRSEFQGNRRKQSSETTLTNIMTRFREFQRQSLQQLRPNSFGELKFLQALTGYTRDSEYVGMRLESGQKFGSPNCGQWSSGFQQWGTPPNQPQWEWGSSPSTQQWDPTFVVPQWETEVQTTTLENEVHVSKNIVRGVSPEFGFMNYASTSKTSHPRRRGGLFNIWGSEQGLNLNETHESDYASDN
ncbi:LOW QUALITY PROTEIN: hypothetical protein N665_1512s0004 [Sinapis alba]|nr:LOW QUALITY PROTEIN: hypothetical protein N665_1512s0004 [Sinapis alba]